MHTEVLALAGLPALVIATRQNSTLLDFMIFLATNGNRADVLNVLKNRCSLSYIRLRLKPLNRNCGQLCCTDTKVEQRFVISVLS